VVEKSNLKKPSIHPKNQDARLLGMPFSASIFTNNESLPNDTKCFLVLGVLFFRTMTNVNFLRLQEKRRQCVQKEREETRFSAGC